MKYHKKSKSLLLLILLLFAIFTVFYFSWLPDPKLGSEKYIPSIILNWSNTYYNIRTAIPFLLIGFLMEFINRGKNKSKQLIIKSIIKHTIISAIIVSTAEIGQHFILHRHPDVMDVLNGILGSLTGAILFYLCYLFSKK